MLKNWKKKNNKEWIKKMENFLNKQQIIDPTKDNYKR